MIPSGVKGAMRYFMMVLLVIAIAGAFVAGRHSVRLPSPEPPRPQSEVDKAMQVEILRREMRYQMSLARPYHKKTADAELKLSLDHPSKEDADRLRDDIKMSKAKSMVYVEAAFAKGKEIEAITGKPEAVE